METNIAVIDHLEMMVQSGDYKGDDLKAIDYASHKLKFVLEKMGQQEKALNIAMIEVSNLLDAAKNQGNVIYEPFLSGFHRDLLRKCLSMQMTIDAIKKVISNKTDEDQLQKQEKLSV